MRSIMQQQELEVPKTTISEPLFAHSCFWLTNRSAKNGIFPPLIIDLNMVVDLPLDKKYLNINLHIRARDSEHSKHLYVFPLNEPLP